MEITWLGHSSFLIEDSKGRKILTDPFDETVGYEIYRGIPDLVTISHHHFDHDYVREIPGNVPKLDKPGAFNIGGIKVTGISSYHDEQKGAKRGKNTIFIIETDNYRICHLGDLGYVLSQSEIDALGKIDVLMIPIGGTFTIDGTEAAALAKSIGSHIVIPMHYKTPAIGFNITGPENFLKLMGDAEIIYSPKLRVEGELKGTNQIKILDYK
ncbi:MAG: MBL fold metallo-hydrolase [Clostridiaceae bacterium]